MPYMNGSDDLLQNASSPAGTDIPDEERPQRLKRRRRSGPFKRVRRFVRRLRLRHQLPRILAVLVVLVAVVGVGGLVVATDAVSRVQSSFNRFQQVVSATASRSGTALTLDDFTLIRASLSNVISTLSDVQRQANLVRPVLALNHFLATGH